MTRARLTLAWRVWLLSLALVSPRFALAQVKLELRASQSEVALGGRLRVELTAMTEEKGTPRDPSLEVPSGFSLGRPRISSRHHVAMNGFSVERLSGISANWTVEAPSRAGHYTLGPARVTLRGRTYLSPLVQIEVVEKPARPRRPRRPDPFDLLGAFGQGSRFRPRSGGLRTLFERAPRELADVSLRDSVAFLHATVDKRNAVVGEQVTLSIYAYGARGLFQEADGSREPAHADFLATRLSASDISKEPVFEFRRAGARWLVVKAREVALFPLRSGELEVGPMTFGFLGRRYGTGVTGLSRKSQPIVVAVTQPPLAGRPPGFLGDVGRFSLRVEVEPRRVEAGGSVAVAATVEGRGRLPTELKLPESSTVQWLEPNVRTEQSVVGTEVGGSRHFSYVVRLEQEGDVELGELQLPYYDPAAQRYRIARRALGRVRVERRTSAPQVDRAATAPPELAELFAFRPRPSAQAEGPVVLGDRAAYWACFLGFPGFVLSLAGVHGALGWTRRWRRGRQPSLWLQAQEALNQARVGKDKDQAAAALERAVYLSLEAATDKKLRAVLLGELRAELDRLGVDPHVAHKASHLLRTCEQLRFGGGSQAEWDSLVAVGEGLVQDLPRLRGSERAASSEERRAHG